MSKALGYLVLSGPERDVEFETFTCCHCNRVRTKHHGQHLDMCQGCAAPICPDNKRCREHCTPWEKKMERIESNLSRDRMLRSMGI